MNKLIAIAAPLLLLCSSLTVSQQGNGRKCSKQTPVLRGYLPGVLLENDQLGEMDSEATNLDECIQDCCDNPNCNSAFFWEESCFPLHCSSQEECLIEKSSKFPQASLAFVEKSDSPLYNDYNASSAIASLPAEADSSSQNPVGQRSTTPTPLPAAATVLVQIPVTAVPVAQQRTTPKHQFPNDKGPEKDKKNWMASIKTENPTTLITDKPITDKPITHKPLPTTSTQPPVVTVRPLEVAVMGWEEAVQLPTNADRKLQASVVGPPGSIGSGHHYRYDWKLLSDPVPGVSMEGGETATLKLSKLKAGVYRFKVTVQGQNPPSLGQAEVNMTVLPPPRVNTPPVAIISPASQEVTLPAKETLLDGSDSSDDERIISYSWDEVKGPLRESSVAGNEVTLKMTHLVPGDYVIKLTVTDSDGAQSSAFANVTVHPEVDYPPVANAGTDEIITLPRNQLILYGNGSTDDKEIVSYEWTQKTDGVADMSGTKSQFLHLSQLEVGTYSFELKVTDTAGQQSSASVTVVVKPEDVKPPEVDAGSDKEISWPGVDHTQLEGSSNIASSQQAQATYHWEKVSGPEGEECVLETPDQPVTKVSQLNTPGVYVFRLVVTDKRGLKGSKSVTVTVKEEKNQRPVAVPGKDLTIQFPVYLVELDGSKSIDDIGIKSYEWTRDPNSPASAIAVEDSEHKAVLKLVNLVPGHYRYKLTVTDLRGLTDFKWVALNVKSNTHLNDLVELNIQADILLFTTRDKEILKRKLAIMLETEDENVIIEEIEESLGTGVVIEFYVVGETGKSVVEKLRAKLQNDEKFLKYVVVSIDTLICQNNCSDHGHCDKVTKLCICERFWLENPFKKHLGEHQSNCEWSILYVILAAMALCLILIGIIWLTVCLVQRKKSKIRKKRRYAILDSFDEEESMEMLEKSSNKKHQYKKMNGNNNSSIMISDSGSSSEEEETIYDTKLVKAGKSGNNLSNGKKSRSSNGLVTKSVNTKNRPALLQQSPTSQVM